MKLNKQQVADEYSTRVGTYNVASMATNPEGKRKLRNLIRKGDIVLDVGCGPGFALPLTLRFAGKRGMVVAADISVDMLREAKRCIESCDFPNRKLNRHGSRIMGLDYDRHLLGRVCFLLCDAERLPIKPWKVNVALALFSLHRMDAEMGIKEMWRVIKPGGYILVEIPGAHDEDAMVFEHIPPSYLPDQLPKGFPPDFRLDACYWTKEQASWKEFKDFCRQRLPWLAEAISRGWFYGYDPLRISFNKLRCNKITSKEFERLLQKWERDNDSGRLGWICFPTRREFCRIVGELEKIGAIVVDCTTTSFGPDVTHLLRTKKLYFELYVRIFSQVLRNHSAILGKPLWTCTETNCHSEACVC